MRQSGLKRAGRECISCEVGRGLRDCLSQGLASASVALLKTVESTRKHGGIIRMTALAATRRAGAELSRRRGGSPRA